jgi:hypothetical protein
MPSQSRIPSQTKRIESKLGGKESASEAHIESITMDVTKAYLQAWPQPLPKPLLAHPSPPLSPHPPASRLHLPSPRAQLQHQAPRKRQPAGGSTDCQAPWPPESGGKSKEIQLRGSLQSLHSSRRGHEMLGCKPKAKRGENRQNRV